MPRPPRWRDLRSGLIVIATLAVAVGAVFAFARIGALRGDTMRLVVVGASARDVLAGTEVWIAGKHVGLVDAIGFRDVASDSAERLAITIDVLTTARPQLRQGAHAQIRSGGSLLGAPILELAGGAPNAPLLQDGDTVRARAQLDPRTVAAGFAAAGQNVPALRTNLAAILDELAEADGTLGAAARGGSFGDVAALGARAAGFARRGSGGTVARLVADGDPVRRRVRQATARADSIRRLLDTPAGAIGRFRRDSTLARQVTVVRDEITLLRALLDEPVGTAGRARHDQVLHQRLGAIEAELGALAADVRANPLRYVVF